MQNNESQNQSALASASPHTVVVGDGWAALACTGFLAHAGHQVTWIQGSGARVFAPLPVVEEGAGVFVWQDLLDRYSISGADARRGSFLREFRNKAFRQPSWLSEPSLEVRREAHRESLWSPETSIAPVSEVSFERSFLEMEEELRSQLLELPNVKRLESALIQGFEFTKSESKKAGEDDQKETVQVLLGSGERVSCTRVIYADDWSELPKYSGLPKPISFLRGRDPIGVIQATFFHDLPALQSLQECFFGVIAKEAGEEIQRHVWGYFTDDAKKSVWSLFLNHSEVEDNHQIAKKFRRIKQTLEKMFTHSGMLESFTSAIKDEQVRFDESVIFGGGEALQEPMSLKKAPGLYFLTDAYGFTSALQQVHALLSAEMEIRNSGEFLDADGEETASSLAQNTQSQGSSSLRSGAESVL